MNFQSLVPEKSVSLFVKGIWVFEENDPNRKTSLPFFADGYPGLMFQETENGLLVNPHKKRMPTFFLYGQTINPIEIEIEGTYKLIVFQLYPFVLNSFFKVSPQTINDNCYDLEQLREIDIQTFVKQLHATKTTIGKTQNITSLLYHLFEARKQVLDFKVKQVIEFILKTKGRESINNLVAKLKLKERTLERRFLNEVGLSPKKFSKIIQFQFSLEQLTLKDFVKLTDIVYENGYADQSHFIKVFKAFTGKTPKTFKKDK